MTERAELVGGIRTLWKGNVAQRTVNPSTGMEHRGASVGLAMKLPARRPRQQGSPRSRGTRLRRLSRAGGTAPWPTYPPGGAVGIRGRWKEVLFISSHCSLDPAAGVSEKLAWCHTSSQDPASPKPILKGVSGASGHHTGKGGVSTDC